MALVGENGAGKSTLMKILTGIYGKDGGTIEYFGKEVEINSPRDAQELGISIVHQELNLMQHLTVAENIFIGRESVRGPLLDKGAQNKRTKALLDELHLEIDPKTVVKTMAVDAANGKTVSDVDTGAKWYDATNIDNADIALLVYD